MNDENEDQVENDGERYLVRIVKIDPSNVVLENNQMEEQKTITKGSSSTANSPAEGDQMEITKNEDCIYGHEVTWSFKSVSRSTGMHETN